MENNNKHFSRGLRSFGHTVFSLFSPKKRNEDIEDEQKKILEEEAIESPWKTVIRKFFRNPLGVIGLIGFLAVFAVVFIGAYMIPFDPFFSSGSMKNIKPGSNYMTIPQEMVDEGIENISSGVTFSVGASKEGHVYSWGLDTNGNLEIPADIAKELESKTVDQVVAGDRHILVLTEDDKIYGWGNNSFEQTALPEELEELVQEEGIAKIGAGDQYSVILTDKGTIKVWGATLPNRLNLIPSRYDQNIEDFETGSVNILILTKDNTVEVIGSKGSEIDTNIPEELANGEIDIVDIGRATRSGSAVDADGNLYAWGSATERATSIPQIDEKVLEVSGGRSHMNALTESGKVYSWGAGEYDVLNTPDGEGYSRIFSGYYNNYAVRADNTYDAWGLNGFRFGTDDLGRDVFTRLIHGGKATLQIAFVAVIIQVLIGVIVGMIAGFYGGRVDNLLMRFSEIIASFPFYPTIITLSATIPPGASQYQRILLVMVLLGLLSWTGIARLVRGQILAEREKDYITAARALGLKEGKIMLAHILPNIVSIVIVQATLGYAGNLLSEAGLSFLGFGVVEPYPSWGNMMTSAQTIDVIEVYWWRWIFPGLAVFLTALTVNLIGDALRDALDPKSLER